MILEILQRDAQISNQELADQVALSPSPCLRRVKQLEEHGIIRRRVALLDHQKLGLKLKVLVLVGLDNHSPETMSHFESMIKSFPEVVQCHLITGQSADYHLTVVAPDMAYFHQFLLKKLTRIEGVNSINSSFVLNQVVDTTELPLNIEASILRA